MIAHRNQKPPTADERRRIDRIMALSCVVCALRGDFKPRPPELHHLVRANRRLGHWYTLPLCTGHHRGIWTDQDVRVAISDGRHAFREAHGYSDLELWQGLQQVLGLDDSLPVSKVFRRVAWELGAARGAMRMSTAARLRSIATLSAGSRCSKAW